MAAVVGVRRLEHSLLVYRRAWRGSLFETVVSPILYLSAMGLALGTFVPPSALGGVSYLAFVAPGLLAAQAMNTGALESAWPLYADLKWTRTLEAAIGTPQSIGDLVVGHALWVVVRVGLVTGIFVAVMALFGAVQSPLVVLAWLSAILTGLAFAMPLAAFTATRRTDISLSVIFRVVITPLFVFSGTFFPVDALPDPIQAIVWLSPLYHGVELARAFTLGDVADPVVLAAHAAILAAIAVVGIFAAHATFRRRLVI